MSVFGWFRQWTDRQRAKRLRWTRWEVLEFRECYSVGDVLVPWAEIVEVVAFKRDLMVVDQIVFGIRCDGESDHLCIEEEHPDWGVIREDLERRFSIGPEWFLDVAFPAFETNLRILWSRPS